MWLYSYLAVTSSVSQPLPSSDESGSLKSNSSPLSSPWDSGAVYWEGGFHFPSLNKSIASLIAFLILGGVGHRCAWHIQVLLYLLFTCTLKLWFRSTNANQLWNWKPEQSLFKSVSKRKALNMISNHSCCRNFSQAVSKDGVGMDTESFQPSAHRVLGN